MDLKHVKKIKIENEWIKHTIKVWAEVKKMLNDVGTISRAMPIVGNVDFPPSMCDHGFRRWAVKGLFVFNQLFEETHLKSFTQLQEQFDLPSSDFYRYLQIRHYITNHKEKERIGKIPNGIEQYFIIISEKRLPVGKHVSHLYKRLLADMVGNTYNIKEKWEIEANIVIEDELWDKLCYRCHKGIKSQQWKEFDWKIKIRYFHTPLFISKFVIDPPAALCWRQCGKTGDYTHIFWDCPVILEYWKNIKEEMEKIVKREVPSNLRFFLLGVISVDVFNADQRYILCVLLLIAKKKHYC